MEKELFIGESETPLTVGELIQKLLKFPTSTRVMISDADTGWFLDVQEVGLRQIPASSPQPALGEVVVLGGNYS